MVALDGAGSACPVGAGPAGERGGAAHDATSASRPTETYRSMEPGAGGNRGQDAPVAGPGSSRGTPSDGSQQHRTAERGTDWWRSYFDQDFVRIYRPLLDARRSRVEARAAMDLLAVPDGARVLDVACGWGRHAVEIARGGFDVVGIDRSPTLIRRAARLARRSAVDAAWVVGDMRELPFDPFFDGALSMFTSLGYFGDDEEDLRTLRGVRRALRADGRLLIETVHRDLIAREFAERDWWTGPGGRVIRVEREFDAVRGMIHDTLRWQDPDGRTGEKQHSLRLRTATEWAVLLDAAGFEVVDWLGEWDGEAFHHESPRLIILCERG
jgi:SAM-dependent methyltransferase